MSVYAIGLNYQTAPLALRERFAFGAEGLGSALGALRRDGAGEAAILSTCNRTERYVAAGKPGDAAGWLARYHGFEPARLEPHLYTLPGAAAVRHAFRVASGLESMVLGEPQILGQMKSAARAAQAAGALGTVLHKLFQRSFAVAKEVRSSTPIGESSVSMAAAAVRLASRLFARISEQRVLLVGAGEMIELCAAHFAAQSPAALTVANRTLERASRLAERFGGRALELRELPQALPEHDIVVSCTASSLPILGKGALERALRARKQKPMFLVDLAVPRDIEAEAGELEGVFLYTVDDLAAIVAESLEARRGAVEQAEAIIETQVGEFMHWLRNRDNVPLICELRSRAEEARREELERSLKRLARGAPAAEVVEALSRRLAGKLLHAPLEALGRSPRR